MSEDKSYGSIGFDQNPHSICSLDFPRNCKYRRAFFLGTMNDLRSNRIILMIYLEPTLMRLWIRYSRTTTAFVFEFHRYVRSLKRLPAPAPTPRSSAKRCA